MVATRSFPTSCRKGRKHKSGVAECFLRFLEEKPADGTLQKAEFKIMRNLLTRNSEATTAIPRDCGGGVAFIVPAILNGFDDVHVRNQRKRVKLSNEILQAISGGGPSSVNMAARALRRSPEEGKTVIAQSKLSPPTVVRKHGSP